jgi:signal transduction histidine kinase
MELALDFRPSPEDPAPLRDRECLEQMVGCLQAFVGHELPNMLVPCQAFARLLGEEAVGLDDEGRLLLERLTALTHKADSWARRLAEMGRLLRDTPWGPAVDLGEVAREAVAEVNALGERPGVAYHVREPMPPLGVSRCLLHAVLVQLLRNSAQAVLTDQDGQVEVTARLEADGCRLAVGDNGRGLSQEQAGLLLEPFAAARLPGACGTGLGFYLVRQAVARWGGALRVRSVMGQGTTVELLLPRQHLPPGGREKP